MNEYLTELHLHTKESSSCSEIPAKQMIETYKKEGYSTIVITDHCSKSKMDRLGNISWREKIDYVYTGFDIAKQYGDELGINILLGVEVTLQITDSDYLVYGIDKEFLYENEKIYEYTLEELYKLCNKKGYLLVQAHPFRDDIQLAPLEYIDGIECEVLVLQYKGKYYALDPVQILFKTNLNFIDTDTSNTYNYEFKVIESSIKFLLQATAQKAAELLGVKDYARFDFRIKKGVPYLFDIAGTPYTIYHSSISYLFTQYYQMPYENIYKVIVACMLSTMNNPFRNRMYTVSPKA